jgi:hypothetical protein
VAIGSLLAELPARAEEPEPDALTMRMTPHVALAPGTIRVTIEVEPDAENRYLIVVADSTEFYRSSMIPLEGKRAKRVHDIEYRGLPAGNYVLEAELVDSSGPRASEQEQFIVTAGGPERW